MTMTSEDHKDCSMQANNLNGVTKFEGHSSLFERCELSVIEVISPLDRLNLHLVRVSRVSTQRRPSSFQLNRLLGVHKSACQIRSASRRFDASCDL
jgi:hypothetical protein